MEECFLVFLPIRHRRHRLRAGLGEWELWSTSLDGMPGWAC
nr:hypothetical protein JVH1_7416 [Rhodococcus sp. JVH1]